MSGITKTLPGRVSPYDPLRIRSRREAPIPAAICWYDGMPLAPQHFQDTQRRIDRVLDYHLGLVAPFHFGVLRLAMSRSKLPSGELSLTVRIQAVMPDHLIIDTMDAPLSQRADPAELRKRSKADASREHPELYGVYLAVPWDRDGRAAVGEPRDARFHRTDGKRLTDDTTGDNDLEISCLAPNARIVIDASPPPDAMWLQIGELRLEGESLLRTDYVPPSIVVAPSAEPDKERGLYELCLGLVERLRDEADRLEQRISNCSKSSDAPLIADLKRQIYHLTAALPAFEALLFTEQSHPLPLYLALNSILGHLAPLGNHPTPAKVIGYCHDDLYASFSDIDSQIRRVIREGIQESFKEHPFVYQEDQEQFILEFRVAWTTRTVVLAVRSRPESDSSASTRRWVDGAVIVAKSQIDQALRSRVLGVVRERYRSSRGDLVPTRDEILFELKDLGAHFNRDEQIVVFNPAPRPDQICPFQAVLYVEEEKDHKEVS